MDITSNYINLDNNNIGNWAEYYSLAKKAWKAHNGFNPAGTLLINNSKTNCIEFYDGPREPFAWITIECLTNISIDSQELFKRWWVRVWGQKHGSHSPCSWKNLPVI